MHKNNQYIKYILKNKYLSQQMLKLYTATKNKHDHQIIVMWHLNDTELSLGSGIYCRHPHCFILSQLSLALRLSDLSFVAHFVRMFNVF